MTRLEQHYRDQVTKDLQAQFSYKSAMEIPRITKITLNMGVGEAVGDKKVMDRAVGDMTAIAGQKPIVNNARKSVASFKIRDGWPVGCKVTLRREKMYEFLDRLVNIAIPRIRDFRGLKRKLDGHGNYNMGLAEQSVFPEVDGDLLDTPQGMNIAMTIRSRSDEDSIALLEAYGFPFRREEVESVG